MSEVLKLKDNMVHTVFEPKDFKWLVEKYMGWDAERYFNNLVEELQEAADGIAQKLNSDFAAYESSLDSNTTCFQDILEQLEQMGNLLQASRMDKSKMFNLVEQIKKQINNQI